MARQPASPTPTSKPILQVQDLQVYYGESHALQGVSLTVERGVLSVVGRNGMGKTTLCNTIVGLMRARSGAVRFDGREISSAEPHEIVRAGVGFVPQGRRLWPSLSVDETLRLSERAGAGGHSWTVDRVYSTFPRLAERRNNGGGQLSGGEQQMLAISRALLSNPRLLIMDEPTEGLAPLIVAQVRELLLRLAGRRVSRCCSSSRTSASRRPCRIRWPSWSTDGSIGSWMRASSPRTAIFSSDCSASGGTARRPSWRPKSATTADASDERPQGV